MMEIAEKQEETKRCLDYQNNSEVDIFEVQEEVNKTQNIIDSSLLHKEKNLINSFKRTLTQSWNY